MEKLEILYDGACIVCSKEINHYLKQDSENLLSSTDISSSKFDAAKYSLLQDDVNLHMHAVDQAGKVYVGIDSFIEIWRRLPKYRFLIPVFENRFLRPILDFGYEVFARHIRPRLPKRNCDDGACEL